MTRFFAALAVAGTALAAGPLHAQTSTMYTADEEILVRVDVTGIGEALAVELGAGMDALPRSVEVPLPIAAAVCEVTVEQLRQVRSVEPHVECNAVSVSPELAEATSAQMEE